MKKSKLNRWHEVDRPMLKENDELLLRAYDMENIKVTDLKNNTGICYIFFSDNGLYFPNYRDDFEEKIIRKNYFEWENMCKSHKIKKVAQRIIFVRDVWKNWYVRGISSKVDTADKLISVLKELTDGYRVITVGNSAGGYMATLTGIKLGGIIHNFSGQFVLHKNYDPRVWEVFQREEIEEINLGEMIAANRDIVVFYYLPEGSADDMAQYRVIENLENVKTFFFNSDKHGRTMLSENIPMVITKRREQLETLCHKYQGNVIEPWEFLRGSSDTVIDFLRIAVRRMWKRIIALSKYVGDQVQIIFRKQRSDAQF